MKRNNCNCFGLLLFLLVLFDFCWAAVDINDQPLREDEHLDNDFLISSDPFPLPVKKTTKQIKVENRNNGTTTTTPSRGGQQQSQQSQQLQRLRGHPQTVHQEQERTTPNKHLTSTPVTSSTTGRQHDDNNKLINSNNNEGMTLLTTSRQSAFGYQYLQQRQQQTPSYQQQQQQRRDSRRLIETYDYRTVEDFSTSSTTTTEAEDVYLSTSTTSEVEKVYQYGIVHVDDNDLDSSTAQQAASSTTLVVKNPEGSPAVVIKDPWQYGHFEDQLYGVVQFDDNNDLTVNNNDMAINTRTSPVSIYEDNAYVEDNNDHLHGIVYAEDYAASKSLSTTHENNFVDGFGQVKEHAHLDTSMHRGPWEKYDDEMYGIVHVDKDSTVVTVADPSSTATSTSDVSIRPWAHGVPLDESYTMEGDEQAAWEAWILAGIEVGDMSMPWTFAPSPGLPDVFPTVAPTTRRPTISPTVFLEPSLSPTTRAPSNRPTTGSPSHAETVSPTDVPTDSPSIMETLSPTKSPIAAPSQAPVTITTVKPTTASPVVSPTPRPTTSRPTIDLARLRSLIESQYPIGGVRFSIDNPGFYQTMAFSWLKEDQQTAPLDDDRRIIQRYALACIFYASNGVENDITDGLFGPGNVPKWINETLWLSSASECTWFGVDLCSDDETILSFVMVANQMSGVLPSETGFLNNLETLLVSGNFINNVGPVGHDWLAELSQLKVLDYSENGFFFDGIPPALYELTRLEIYDCSQNYYFGEIQTFDFPPSLEVVRVADNDFAGSLSWMTMLPSLTEVDVSQNSEIIGPLPDTFNSGLRIFSAGKCAITGSIPDGIVAASNLEIFSAPDNKLSGNLEVFGNLSTLRILDVHDNSFDGQIPVVLGQLGSLETLRLDSNEILGAMPEEICALLDGKLEVLGADCIGDNVIPVPCDCCTCCSTLLCDFMEAEA